MHRRIFTRRSCRWAVCSFPYGCGARNVLKRRITTQMRDLDEAKAEAGLAALRALARRVGYGEVFVDKWVDYCMIEDEILEASAVGERRIDIGQARERRRCFLTRMAARGRGRIASAAGLRREEWRKQPN